MDAEPLNEILDLSTWLTVDMGIALLRATFVILLGYGVGRLVGAGVERMVARTSKRSYAMLMKRVAFTLTVGAAVASALSELGFDLGFLMGAAGVATVALGFASQTSASNVISGIFLLTEGSLAVGDTIRIGATVGQVVAIDLLSVKLRTFDNLLVRVPNESLVKAEITNLTRFQIRRVAACLRVSFESDLRRTKDVLLEVADAYDRVLRDPEPTVVIESFGESGVDVELDCWVASQGYVEAKTELLLRVKDALDRHGIEMAVPARRIVGDKDERVVG